jgi:hypothetical protein
VAVEDIERRLSEEAEHAWERAWVELRKFPDCSEINDPCVCLFKILLERVIAAEETDREIEILFARLLNEVQDDSWCAIRCEFVDEKANA